MGKILGYSAKGAGLGAISAVGLFIIGFGLEFVNLGCAILTCDCDRDMMFEWSGMWGLFIFCLIGGAIVGACYGVYRRKEDEEAEIARQKAENSEEARRQRVAWASQAKQKALNLNNECSKNKTADKPLVSTTYKADIQMADIMAALTKITEMQGRVDALAEELSKEDNASL